MWVQINALQMWRDHFVNIVADYIQPTALMLFFQRRNLSRDPDLKHLLPMDEEGTGLYDSVKDGILLW